MIPKVWKPTTKKNIYNLVGGFSPTHLKNMHKANWIISPIRKYLKPPHTPSSSSRDLVKGPIFVAIFFGRKSDVHLGNSSGSRIEEAGRSWVMFLRITLHEKCREKILASSQLDPPWVQRPANVGLFHRQNQFYDRNNVTRNFLMISYDFCKLSQSIHVWNIYLHVP